MLSESDLDGLRWRWLLPLALMSDDILLASHEIVRELPFRHQSISEIIIIELCSIEHH